MENLELFISLATTCIGLVVAVAAVIAKYARSAKARKAAEQTIEICNALLPYIEKAESYVNYSGEEKKEYVMTKANRYAIENGISFDETEVSERVEELIALTKEVNATKSDNVCSDTNTSSTEGAAASKAVITISNKK